MKARHPCRRAILTIAFLCFLPAAAGAQRVRNVQTVRWEQEVPSVRSDLVATPDSVLLRSASYPRILAGTFVGGAAGALAGAGIGYLAFSNADGEDELAGAILGMVAMAALYPVGSAVGAHYAATSEGLAPSGGKVLVASVLSAGVGVLAAGTLGVPGVVLGAAGHLLLTSYAAYAAPVAADAQAEQGGTALAADMRSR